MLVLVCQLTFSYTVWYWFHGNFVIIGGNKVWFISASPSSIMALCLVSLINSKDPLSICSRFTSVFSVSTRMSYTLHCIINKRANIPIERYIHTYNT